MKTHKLIFSLLSIFLFSIGHLQAQSGIDFSQPEVQELVRSAFIKSETYTLDQKLEKQFLQYYIDKNIDEHIAKKNIFLFKAVMNPALEKTERLTVIQYLKKRFAYRSDPQFPTEMLDDAEKLLEKTN